MVNRPRIRVGYEHPHNGLYYGLDVMFMDFDVEMVPMEVLLGVGHVSEASVNQFNHGLRWNHW